MADETSQAPAFQAATYTALGTPREQVKLPADVFDGIVNMPVMHRVVTAYLANQREGNAKTKTRSFVTGGNQKPWRQKGTGRARAGSTRSPLWPGGGTVFGPIPRSYDQAVPKKMKALARRSAFNARARENSVFVIDKFGYEEPRTRVLAGLLQRMGVDGQKVLILTDGSKPNVYLSGRNLPKVEVLPYSDVSTYHLLWSDVVLIEATAIGHTLTPIVEKEGAPMKRARKAADEGEEKATKKGTSRGAKTAPKAKAKAAPKKTARAAAPKKKAAKKTSAPKKKGTSPGSASKKKGK
jgi:large subunit ribosomal protein L4